LLCANGCLIIAKKLPPLRIEKLVRFDFLLTALSLFISRYLARAAFEAKFCLIGTFISLFALNFFCGKQLPKKEPGMAVAFKPASAPLASPSLAAESI
jgi:hypothetical protein